MSGHHSFRTLQARIAADLERRARRESERRLSEAIIELAALREARGATQQQIAEAWDATQANVSQIEHTLEKTAGGGRRCGAPLLLLRDPAACAPTGCC
jgi:DNA-binding XRE family transcriptional regulator